METLKEQVQATETLEQKIKNASNKENVPYNILQKLHSYLKDVKRNLDDNPLVLLSSIAHKNSLSTDYNAVLYDNDFVTMGIAGKPKTHKQWEAGEPTVEMAVRLYKLNRLGRVEMDKNIKKRAGRPPKKYPEMIQAKLNRVEGDYPDRIKAVYLLMQEIKDKIDENPKCKLSGTEKPYKLSPVYATAMRSMGFFNKSGTNFDQTYEWTGGDVDIIKAMKVDKIAKSKMKSYNKKSKDRTKKMKLKQEARFKKTETPAIEAEEFDIKDIKISDEIIGRIENFLNDVYENHGKDDFKLYDTGDKHKLHTSYIARVKAVKLLKNHGNNRNPDYEWLADKPDAEMAKFIYIEGQKIIQKAIYKKKREKSELIKNYKESEAAEPVTETIVQKETPEEIAAGNFPLPDYPSPLVSDTKKLLKGVKNLLKKAEVDRKKIVITETEKIYTVLGFIRVRIKTKNQYNKL